MTAVSPADERPDELVQRLHAWAGASGRALELRVAQRFRRCGARHVTPSFAYVDPTTEAQREGDVLAEFTWNDGSNPPLPCKLMVVVECKSSVSKPWVGFLPEEEVSPRTDSLAEWLVHGWAPYTRTNDRVPELWIGRPPLDDRVPASHVVAANLGQAEAKANEKNEAGDAVRQVLAAAEASKERAVTAGRRPGASEGTFIVAAVVTAAPLFTSRLNNSGAIEFERTERFSTWGYVGAGRRRVFIMNESRVAEFATELNELVRRALQ